MNKQLIKIGNSYFSLFKAKKDVTKLIKKVITNKKGFQQTVYTAPEEIKKGWLNTFMSFFHFKDKKQAEDRIEQDYKTNNVDKMGLTLDGWKAHVAEYFLHRDKWKKFFSGSKGKENTGGGKGTGKGGGKKEGGGKTTTTAKFKLSVMKLINELYGKEPPKAKTQKPKITGGGKGKEDKLTRWKSGNLSGIEGQKFILRTTMMDDKFRPESIKDEITIKKVENNWVSYDSAEGMGSGGGMSVRGFVESLNNGELTLPALKGKIKENSDGSKVVTGAETTDAEEKEREEEEKKAAREGYFNEKPAEILNVGADVWGAARHKFDTYEHLDANINQMEKDGTAAAYVIKRNIIGEYGLANKAERVAKGETEYKVIASYTVREYLAKTPPDNPEDRAKYVEFCRAIQRLDQETKDAKTFYGGLADVFAKLFPIPEVAGEEGRWYGSDTIEKEGQRANKIIGNPLAAFLWKLNGQERLYRAVRSYEMKNKKERGKINNLDHIKYGEENPSSYTSKELESEIIGAIKAAGLKLKKGDNVVFTDSLKDKVYYSRTYYPTPEDEKQYQKVQDAFREINEFSYSLYRIKTSAQRKEEIVNTLNERYGASFKIDDDEDKIHKFLEETKEFLTKKAGKHRVTDRYYPSEKGTVVKVKEKEVCVMFKFPDKDGDSTTKYFWLKPDQLKPENIESVKRDVGKTSTARLDLLLEAKVERKGGKSFEGISVEDAQKQLVENFKFKAVQYGNSMPNTERQYHTQWTLQSMSDLSEILGLPLDEITAKGKLGVAFGARGGISMKGAVAHYEPSTKMINLTRASGFGSLAHEWGHFMDNILSGNVANYISTDRIYKKNPGSLKDLPHGSIVKYRGKRYFFDKNAPSSNYPFALLKSGQTEPDTSSRYLGFRGVYSSYDVEIPDESNKHIGIAYEIAKMSKESLQEQTKAKISKFERGSSEAEFYRKSILESAYYNKKNECFARAFESYVADKLEDNGRKNTYLSSKAKTFEKDGGTIYPQGEYRTKINKLFDSFFEELRKTDDLKKAIELFFNHDNITIIRKFNPVTKEFEFRRLAR